MAADGLEEMAVDVFAEVLWKPCAAVGHSALVELAGDGVIGAEFLLGETERHGLLVSPC